MTPRLREPLKKHFDEISPQGGGSAIHVFPPLMIYAIIGRVKNNIVHISGGGGEVGLNPSKCFFKVPLLSRFIIIITLDISGVQIVIQ